MSYQWAVIGAGPAGIAAVGKLLDLGIVAKDIAWIDPKFKVGDFGTLWRNVPSNTHIGLFLKFLQAVESFEYSQAPDFAINHEDPEKTCRLSVMADPLQWVSDHLKKKVLTIQDTAENMFLKNRHWTIQFKNAEIQAQNVILAVGAEPKNLAFSALPIIPLQDAMDAERILNHITHDETVAVFGSSHSAMLVLRNLVESGVKRIINFYRSPLCYAVYLDNWILFDDTGLKGPTADWARNYVDGKLPSNLERVYSNQENLEHHLPQCNKVVYTVGFERRLLPVIQDMGPLKYIEQCGIIAPGLFGFGIAFPEAKCNPVGILEYRVGLWKFMTYLQRVMPMWLKYYA